MSEQVHVLNAEASIAKPDQIIIGQKLYEKLNDKHKQAFRQISGTSSVEDYMNEVSKGKYLFYASGRIETTSGGTMHHY